MHEPSYRDEGSQCSSWNEWAWWSWLSKYAGFSNDWLPLVKANRLLPQSLPSSLDIKEIIFHTDSENCNGCFLIPVVFLLPSKKLLKAYVKFAGWRWVGLKPDPRTTDNWAMSSCYLGLSGKLLWISVGAWVRGAWMCGCGRAESIPDAQMQVSLLLFPLHNTISLLGNTLSALLLEIIIKLKQLACFQQGRWANPRLTRLFLSCRGEG